MCSANNKREVKQVTIDETIVPACGARSSSKTSHSNAQIYQSALVDKSSSDEFELAKDHFSTTYILEYDTSDDFDVTEPNRTSKKVYSTPKTSQKSDKRRPKTTATTKTGSCNCKTSRQNSLAKSSQKYNINVPEISAKYSSSGIIKIPIEVQLSLKQSGYYAPVKQENLPEEVKPVLEEARSVSKKEELPSIKCIYQDCSAWEFMETYLDELLDDPRDERGNVAGSAHANNLVFNADCTDHYAEQYHKVGYVTFEDDYIVPIDPEDLIPPEYYAKDKDSFWVEEVPEKELTVVDHDSRIHWEDVCLPATGTVEIASAPPEPEEPIMPHRIPVPEGYKPPPRRSSSADARESSKKKKKGGLSGCCGGDDDDDDDDDAPRTRKQVSILHLKPVPKLSLIYGQQCPENEPYTRRLLKAYPHHEHSDSPCSSDPEMPWPKILLPEAVKIRSVDIIDLTEAKSEPTTSTNALCLCASYNDKPDVKPDMKKLSEPNNIPSKNSVATNDLCKCASNKDELNKLDVKPDIKKLSELITALPKSSVSFRNDKLVTLYPPPNLPVVESKSNTFKPEVTTRKEPIGIIKTKLSGHSKSDQGIMRTKVTISGKDLNRFQESQGKIKSSNIIKGSGYSQLETKQICPPTSEVKVSPSRSSKKICPATSQAKMASSRSTPVLPKEEPCMPKTCSSNVKVESKELGNKPLKLSSSSHTIKPDPVISALIACEAELKPVKQALNTVQQKLRNMNMPELDSIFSKGTELANVFLNKAQQNRCTCGTSYVSGYKPTTTTRMEPAKVKFMNDRMTTYARVKSSYPVSYTNPSPSSTYMSQRPRPYVEQCQYGLAPYYGQYQSSPSQSSSCVPSVQNFSMRPNYGRNDLYPDERGQQKSAFRGRGHRNKKHVKYQRDQSEDWRSPDRSRRNCCCSSSNYSSHNRFHPRKSDDEMTFTSSSSPSEDSLPKTRCVRRRSRRLVPKVKSKTSGIVSRQSLCPFLEAMKSIMILDSKKNVKKGVNGVSYDTKLSTKKIKNMRMHMRVRTSKNTKK